MSGNDSFYSDRLVLNAHTKVCDAATVLSEPTTDSWVIGRVGPDSSPSNVNKVARISH